MSLVGTQIQSDSYVSTSSGGKRGSGACYGSGGCNFVVEAQCLNNDNSKSMSHTMLNTSNKQVSKNFQKAKTSSLRLNMNNLSNDLITAIARKYTQVSWEHDSSIIFP